MYRLLESSSCRLPLCSSIPYFLKISRHVRNAAIFSEKHGFLNELHNTDCVLLVNYVFDWFRDGNIPRSRRLFMQLLSKSLLTKNI